MDMPLRGSIPRKKLALRPPLPYPFRNQYFTGVR